MAIRSKSKVEMGMFRLANVRSCAGAVALVALSANSLSCVAQPADAAPSFRSAQKNTDAPVIQTDFALSIDGEFVIGTSGYGSRLHRGLAETDYWHGRFSTHGMTGKGPDAPGGVHLLNRAGESFSITANKGDESYELEGSATALASGAIDFSSILKHNDAIVSRPRLVVRDGEPASIELGDETDQIGNDGRSIKLEITLKRVDAALLPAKQPQLADLTVADDKTKPTENVSSRKMRPPRYPPAAVRAHVQGDVLVDVIVDERGMPASAEVVGIEPPSAIELGGAAVVAALQWRYRPGLRDGRAVGGTLTVPVSFHLASIDGAPDEQSDPARALAVSYRKLTTPMYPAHAVLNKVTGKVYTEVQVGADGSVVTARIEQIAPAAASELGEAALEAIKTWQFNPQVTDGKSIASQVRVPIVFQIASVAPTLQTEQPLPPAANTLQTIIVEGTPSIAE